MIQQRRRRTTVRSVKKGTEKERGAAGLPEDTWTLTDVNVFV
jgi:hypothetical protein